MTSKALSVVSSDSVRELLEQAEKPLAAALTGKGLDLAEFAVALDTACAQDENLAAAVTSNPRSVRNAILTCASLGLRPGKVHKHFALVPYKGVVTGIIEWRGYIDIGNRAGSLESAVVCEVVYKGDEFAYDRLSGEVRHPFDIFADDDKKKTDATIVGAYATCEVKGRTGFATVVLPRREIEKRRSYSKVQSKDGAWATSYASMCKKTAVRALFESGKIPLNAQTISTIQDVETKEDDLIVDAQATVRDTASVPGDDAGGVVNKHDGLVLQIERVALEAGVEMAEILEKASKKWGRQIGHISALNTGQLEALLGSLEQKRDEQKSEATS